MDTEFTSVFTQLFTNDDDVRYIIALYSISGVNMVQMVERFYHENKDSEGVEKLIMDAIKKEISQYINS